MITGLGSYVFFISLKEVAELLLCQCPVWEKYSYQNENRLRRNSQIHTTENQQ